MIPCYQLCKDHQCPHWIPYLLDCEKLPDDCEFAIEHLVRDREDQLLDRLRHGFWRGYHENGQLRYEGNYVNGMQDGLWRYWNNNGQLSYEGIYIDGEEAGF